MIHYVGSECILTSDRFKKGFAYPPKVNCRGPLDQTKALRQFFKEARCGIGLYPFLTSTGTTECVQCAPGSTFAEDRVCSINQYCSDTGVCTDLVKHPFLDKLCSYKTYKHSKESSCGPGLVCNDNVCSICIEGAKILEAGIKCDNQTWRIYHENNIQSIKPIIHPSQYSVIDVATLILLIFVLLVFSISFYVYIGIQKYKYFNDPGSYSKVDIACIDSNINSTSTDNLKQKNSNKNATKQNSFTLHQSEMKHLIVNSALNMKNSYQTPLKILNSTNKHTRQTEPHKVISAEEGYKNNSLVTHEKLITKQSSQQLNIHNQLYPVYKVSVTNRYSQSDNLHKCQEKENPLDSHNCGPNKMNNSSETQWRIAENYTMYQTIDDDSFNCVPQKSDFIDKHNQNNYPPSPMHTNIPF